MEGNLLQIYDSMQFFAIFFNPRETCNHIQFLVHSCICNPKQSFAILYTILQTYIIVRIFFFFKISQRVTACEAHLKYMGKFFIFTKLDSHFRV